MSIAITHIQTKQSVRTNGNLALAPESAELPARPAPVRAVPAGAEARGFVLYVGLSEAAAAADDVDLAELVSALKELTAKLSPSAETHAAVALAPAGAGGRDVDVVRRALHDPSIRRAEPVAEPDLGVTIDLSRKRVALGDDIAPLTFKEFELLQHIVLREGQTVERSAIIDALWPDADDAERPSERTIDVHVRRLRSKLGNYADIIRTVRGSGYRFDRHADVTVLATGGPSPDRF